MKNRQAVVLTCTLGIALLVGGCGNAQRDATEAAVNAAQTAINAATNTAEKYVPEQTKAAQEALKAAKDYMAKGDYGAALKSAQDGAQKAKDALSAASAKKEEWANTWNSLNQSVPKTMNEIQAKMNAYVKSGKLPKGVDQTQMEAAKVQFEQLKQGWTDATAAYKNGNFVDAMSKATTFKDGLAKVKELLGIQQ
ncbi:MAG TPA: hypothetical protein VGH37_10095 [Candidatus Acidoferrum sp.]|jgi:hypothetical protein